MASNKVIFTGKTTFSIKSKVLYNFVIDFFFYFEIETLTFEAREHCEIPHHEAYTRLLYLNTTYITIANSVHQLFEAKQN